MSSTALPSRQRPLQEREQLDLFRALPGDMAPREAGAVYEKLTEDYPALYRKHAFTDPKQLGERLGGLLSETALGDLIASPE